MGTRRCFSFLSMAMWLPCAWVNSRVHIIPLKSFFCYNFKRIFLPFFTFTNFLLSPVFAQQFFFFWILWILALFYGKHKCLHRIFDIRKAWIAECKFPTIKRAPERCSTDGQKQQEEALNMGEWVFRCFGWMWVQGCVAALTASPTKKIQSKWVWNDLFKKFNYTQFMIFYGVSWYLCCVWLMMNVVGV